MKIIKYMKNIFSNLKLVFGDYRLFIITIVIAILFYSANALIPQIGTLFITINRLGFYGIFKYYFTLIYAFKDTITLISFVTLTTISVLFGVLFSIVYYKTKHLKSATDKKIGMLSSIGIFLGVLAPGCSACGIGLLSVFGFSAAMIQFLPYNGLELSIFSIIMLIISIATISKNLFVCQLENRDN